MKIINQSKTNFMTSKGAFSIGKIMDFEEAEAKTLLRKKPDGSPVYAGLNLVDDLEVKETSKPKAKK